MMEFPGSFIATTEEVIPGEGVMEEEGNVYAVVAGKKVSAKGMVSVANKKAVRPLRKGDVVYGLVQNLYESVALVEFQAEDATVSASNNYAYLRISEVQKRYTESFAECLKVGDYIKAKIVEVKKLGIYLTIAWPELGVVTAFCSYCRKEMKDQGRSFFCKDCGRLEERKKPI